MLAFVYWIEDLRDPRIDGVLFSSLTDFDGRTYALTGVTLDRFAALSRTRSPSWDAVDCPTSAFRDALEPLGALLGFPDEGRLRTMTPPDEGT